MTYQRGSKIEGVHGTSYYIAPEVLGSNYDERCDVWSIGVIMYVLLSGRAPFDDEDDAVVARKVLKGVYDLETSPWPNVSDSAKDMIQQMLTKDYRNRPFARDLLNHPWL